MRVGLFDSLGGEVSGVGCGGGGVGEALEEGRCGGGGLGCRAESRAGEHGGGMGGGRRAPGDTSST